jgi:hypothetical protein
MFLKERDQSLADALSAAFASNGQQVEFAVLVHHLAVGQSVSA